MEEASRRLRCPRCESAGTVRLSLTAGSVTEAECRVCRYRLPTIAGVPDFAEHIGLDDPTFSRAQKTMNTRFFARIYESPVWRPLHTLAGSGLTLQEEVNEVIALAGTRQASAVADLGCGTGHYARALARRYPGAMVYGLDLSPGMLERGLQLAGRDELNVFFVRGDLCRLPFETRTLDHVNCSGTLHLLPDVKPVWKEIHRVLTPGGIFTSMIVGRSSGFLGRVQQRLGRRWGTTFYTPRQLEEELSEAGFISFTSVPHRVTLLFRALKKDVSGPARDG